MKNKMLFEIKQQMYEMSIGGDERNKPKVSALIRKMHNQCMATPPRLMVVPRIDNNKKPCSTLYEVISRSFHSLQNQVL
jgi:hypothetical protein